MLLSTLLMLAALTGCGGTQREAPAEQATAAALLESPASTADGRPGALPVDGAHVWEELDSRGYVVPRPSRGVSSLAQAQLAPGRERFSEGGDVADNGEASTVSAAAGEFSHAMYRLTMGGQQPGAISVDVNLLPSLGGGASSYWVGLADYGSDRWQWFGPLSDAQTTFTPPAGDWLSPLGNAFVAVLAHDGASFDVVAVAAAPDDAGDSTPPPAPTAPQLTPVAGGLELEWLPVLAGDLAGYRIYYRFAPIAPSTPTSDLRSVEYLEGTTRTVLELPRRLTYVALAAVDTSGNESALSPATAALPGIGAPPQLTVSVDAVSGQRGELITLSVSGATTYDYDLDGDGVYDVTGSTDTAMSVDTSRFGIIRPRVRGSGPDGQAVALGSVSLFITGNSRPVANAQVTPQTGVVPLVCSFNGTGEDFDGSIAQYAWDFNGDGIYDHISAADGETAHQYNTAGFYNAKLRVTDDLGAWDVDTVTIQVQPALVSVSASPAGLDPGKSSQLTASPPLPASAFAWDLDDDGTYETDTGASNKVEVSFTLAGIHTVGVRATLSSGGTAFGAVDLTVHGWKFTDGIMTESGGFVSLAVVDGVPAIAAVAQDAGAYGLRYVRATDALGENWNAPITVHVEPGIFVGSFPSLQIVDGNPAVAFLRGTANDLLYVRASDALGTAWNAPVAVDTAGDIRWWCTLQVVNGHPAISYFDDNLDDPRYVRATDAQGAAWGAPLSPFSSADLEGSSNSLAVVNGRPAMLFGNNTDGNLYYIRANDSDGTAWGAPVTVNFGGTSLNGCSLTIINGLPAFATSTTTGDIRYRRAVNVDGTAWGATSQVYTDGQSYNPALAEVNGLPLIGYEDFSIFGLRAAWPHNGLGMDFQNYFLTYNAFASQPRRSIEAAEVNGRPCLAFARDFASGYSFAVLY